MSSQGLYPLAVDDPTLISVMLLPSYYPSNNVMLVELPGPPIGYLVLDLILDLQPVGRLGECGLHRLLVQLVKLVVEACNHVLNLRALLLGLQPLNDCLLDLLRCHLGVGRAQHPVHVLLTQHVVYRRILVLVQQAEEALVNQLQGRLVEGGGDTLLGADVEVVRVEAG